MNVKGCCYDNACVESFFHYLKVDCIPAERSSSQEAMKITVFDYIKRDYNRWHHHSTRVNSAQNRLKPRTSLSRMPTIYE